MVKTTFADSFSSEQVGPFLLQLKHQYHQPSLLGSDPISFLHSSNLKDFHLESALEEKEITAPLAALFAYGRVPQILKSVQEALNGLRREGALLKSVDAFEAVRSLKHLKEVSNRLWPKWKHRFHTAVDLGLLVACIAKSRKKHGSIGHHFLSHHSGDTIQNGIEGLATDWLLEASEIYGVKSVERLPQATRFLFSRPSGESVCKRWVMWMRWMGRTDSIDLGLWSYKNQLTKNSTRFLKPSELLLPLDTHVARIGNYLGIVSEKTIHWKTVLRSSERLLSISPEDPIQFDFALARLGILSECKKRFEDSICTRCSLMGGCRLAMQNAGNLMKARKINKTTRIGKEMSACETG